MNPCNQSSRAASLIGGRPFLLLLAGGLAVALALTAAAAPSAQAWPSINQQAKKACKKKKKAKAKKTCIRKKKQQLNRTKGDVSVMTRNLYLGGNLGGPIEADGLPAFQVANGALLRAVDANDFRKRAKGLASEINRKKPDVVGLQEVALWKLGKWSLAVLSDPTKSTANRVKYDFLDLLMRELNRGKQRYQKVKVTEQFDFEAPADYPLPASNPSGPAESSNGRLTMRDVIIARVGAGVTWRRKSVREGRFSTLNKETVSGIDVTVARGWNSAEFKVRNAPKFRFVNTHLESMGDDKNKVIDCMTEPAEGFASNPVSIRCSQAKELFDKAIKPSKLPVIALGDFNSNNQSDWDTNCPSEENVDGSLVGSNGGFCGDEFAYRALMSLGMKNVGPRTPSCCLEGDVLAASGSGQASNFDHQVDHILTRTSDKVTMLSSSVTGLKPVNGFWNSDHAGVYSKLRLRP